MDARNLWTARWGSLGTVHQGLWTGALRVFGLIRQATHRLSDAARWTLTLLLGLVLIVAGLVMIFTPGPGWGAIILGFYVLSREFTWARRALDRLVAMLEQRRHQLPKFVGKLLDERQRRRQIQLALAKAHEPPDRMIDLDDEHDAVHAGGAEDSPDGISRRPASDADA